MESRNVIRFLAILFCLLSIVFTALFYVEYNAADMLSQELSKSVEENLSSRGIALSSESLVTKTPDASVFLCKVSDYHERDFEISDKILDFTFAGQKINKVDFETPEGVSVGFYNALSEKGEKQLGKMVFSNNDFGIQYFDFRYEKEETPPLGVVSGFEIELSYDDRKTVNKFIKCLGENADFSSRVVGTCEYKGTTLVSVEQLLDNTQIKDMYINLLLWNGEIISAQGAWLNAKVEKEYYSPLLDGMNVLYKLPLDKVSELTLSEVVFSIRQTSEQNYYVMPVWKIQYVDTDNNVNTEYFDALDEQN